MELPQYYLQVLDHLSEGVYIVNLERKIFYWNQPAAAITGFSAEEVVHFHCYNNILDHRDENMQPLCQGGCALSWALEKGTPIEKSVFLRHKEGHRIPVEIKVAPVLDGDGGVVGAVEIFSDASAHFRLEQINKQLRRMIRVDLLTRIPNRRAILEALEREFQRYRRYGTPFSVIFVDIDHFKQVNDGFGHVAGDKTLRWFAGEISRRLRKSDIMGRYGGEEFLILLPATGSPQAVKTAEDLRADIEAAPCPATEKRLTASFGVTGIREGDSVESLLERVDAALYSSKREGRNRVTEL